MNCGTNCQLSTKGTAKPCVINASVVIYYFCARGNDPPLPLLAEKRLEQVGSLRTVDVRRASGTVSEEWCP
jgi:hypothetical protein